MFVKILWILFISMLPLIELRGAVPVGAALGVPFYYNLPAAIIGNLIPIPFILLFIPKILDFMERFKIFKPIVGWVKRKAMKHSSKIVTESHEKTIETTNENEQTPEDTENETTEQAVREEARGTQAPCASQAAETKKEKSRLAKLFGIYSGLLLFVALPVPGTGAWTGALVAALFNLPKRQSFLAIAGGVILCSVIMGLASYGVLGFLEFLL